MGITLERGLHFHLTLLHRNTITKKMKLALALLLVATAFAQEDGGCLDQCSEDYEGTDLDKCALGCRLDACDSDFNCECEVDYTWECCMDDCDDGDTECEAGCDTYLADPNADPCDADSDSFDEMGCCMSNCESDDETECVEFCTDSLSQFDEAEWSWEGCMDDCEDDYDVCEADCDAMAAAVADFNACVAACDDDDACVMGCYD